MGKTRLLYVFGLVIFIGAIIVNSSVTADLIGLKYGEKDINLNYSIDNLMEYNDYVFLLYSVITGHQNFNSNQPLSFYKFSRPKVYAIETEEFLTYKSKCNESMWHDFFKNNPSIISSIDELDSYITVQENDPLKSADIFLKISYIDEKQNRLGVDRNMVKYTYNDGTYEELPISTRYGLPKPSKTALLPYWFESLWFVWIPVFSLISIISILVYRKRITSPQ